MRCALYIVAVNLCALLPLFAAPAIAQSNPPSNATTKIESIFDCAEINIHFEQDPTLTREENLARMDEALLESLSKFDSCQRAKSFNKSSQSAANHSGSEGDGSAGKGAAANEAKGESSPDAVESVAASDMSGEEKTEQTETASQSGWNADSSKEASSLNEGAGKATNVEPSAMGGNGKVPEDIPPADNDSVLEAQIRQAAINETDPKIKEKLWDEYRKYKGLPKK